ncbi:hypothetical protein [Bacteroides thetaiotaomicron]|nr:hypothetical protein [Bacteroides thetaiotaomicron]MCB7311201.1 hypothetical protein [Bacteroides thetaiotaomicron]MCG4874310.1 hypothetical protein [Bacteroides thetaiotaomicron]
MKKVAILIILIMASGLSMYGQNSYKVTSLVKLSDIISVPLKLGRIKN